MRGYVYRSVNTSLVVIAVKGTTLAVGKHSDTARNDQLNVRLEMRR